MRAFQQQGNTVTFTANTSAPTPVQCAFFTQQLSACEVRVINSGSNMVFLGVGNSAAEATAKAIVGAGPAIPILPGTDEILSFNSNSYFTGITASGTSVLYMTPGSGL